MPEKKGLDQRSAVAEMIAIADQIGEVAAEGRAEYDDPKRNLFSRLGLLAVRLGEASNAAGVSFRKANPTVPWAEIWDVRQRLAHPYVTKSEVDPDELWEYVTGVVPKVRYRLRRPKYTDRS
jgi:uncharacterized protein with HEPN domain